MGKYVIRASIHTFLSATRCFPLSKEIKMKSRNMNVNVNIMNRLLLVLVMVFSVVSTSYAQNENTITKIFVVRHAEKVDDGTKDPPLSEAGVKRADNLAKMLADCKVEALFSTQFKRTMQTLAPISVQQKIPIVTYNPSDKVFVRELLKANKGKTIVISGHSNTAPMLVNSLLKVNKYDQLPDSEYSNVWVVIFKNDELVDCSLLHY